MFRSVLGGARADVSEFYKKKCESNPEADKELNAHDSLSGFLEENRD